MKRQIMKLSYTMSLTHTHIPAVASAVSVKPSVLGEFLEKGIQQHGILM